MKKIGLTQRVEVVASYQERRDCLDQSWINLLLELGYTPIPLPIIFPPHTLVALIIAAQNKNMVVNPQYP